MTRPAAPSPENTASVDERLAIMGEEIEVGRQVAAALHPAGRLQLRIRSRQTWKPHWKTP